jgi:hypothetical protein
MATVLKGLYASWSILRVVRLVKNAGNSPERESWTCLSSTRDPKPPP